METTNDGFTFKRISGRIQERKNTKFTEVKKDAGNSFNKNDFLFQKICKNNELIKKQEKKRKSGEFKIEIVDKNKKNTVHTVNMKLRGQNKKVKKTQQKIELEKSIDLSTDYDEIVEMDNKIKNDLFDKSMLEIHKVEDKKEVKNVDEKYSHDEKKNVYEWGNAELGNNINENNIVIEETRLNNKQNNHINDNVKVKSHEIHKLVKNPDINNIVKKCVLYLEDKTGYGREIIEMCNEKRLCDINYKDEIDTAIFKTSEIRNEINKWDDVYKKLAKSEMVTIDAIDKIEIEREDANRDQIKKQFEEKVNRLKSSEKKLKYFFENTKNKSEKLLKNIFGAAEDRNVDALFLLKAMSKLGR